MDGQKLNVNLPDYENDDTGRRYIFMLSFSFYYFVEKKYYNRVKYIKLFIRFIPFSSMNNEKNCLLNVNNGKESSFDWNNSMI